MDGLTVYSRSHQKQGVVVRMSNLAYVVQFFTCGQIKLLMGSDLEVLH